MIVRIVRYRIENDAWLVEKQREKIARCLFFKTLCEYTNVAHDDNAGYFCSLRTKLVYLGG